MGSCANTRDGILAGVCDDAESNPIRRSVRVQECKSQSSRVISYHTSEVNGSRIPREIGQSVAVGSKVVLCRAVKPYSCTF